MDSIGKLSPQEAINLAKRVLDIEARAVEELALRLDESFATALQIILGCRGRIVVSGIGKSGHIASKLASTLASTGTPAFFVHPAEASHGDLGMITRDDVLIALSNSGESGELLVIVPIIKREGAKLIAMTGNAASSLAREADAHLNTSVSEEACPLGLAPTASTTAALALGDALAVALLEARGFSEKDFARSHPGGRLGRQLLTHVSDVMRSGDAIPQVPEKVMLNDAILEMSRKGMGMTAIVRDDQPVGIFTDGDLRRLLERGSDIRSTPVIDAMTKAPHTVSPTRLAVEVVKTMEDYRINQILVVDAHGKLVGALNTHDLMQAKVI
ncbi:MAG: KpsF/GutQ family sugar-phosphate isomerase [Betaproteobacteria bacterium]|jgi:arabinose-5-phosphate isomerase|nr:MAG: KpsF/GutQ family sugar-phosphate isomerase [Betaproteobacteria bacterium]